MAEGTGWVMGVGRREMVADLLSSLFYRRNGERRSRAKGNLEKVVKSEIFLFSFSVSCTSKEGVASVRQRDRECHRSSLQTTEQT